MFHTTKNILSGREAAWNAKFAPYYAGLRSQANETLSRIEADDPPPILRELTIHKNATSFSKRVALAYQGLLTISEDVVKVMLLGKRQRPLIKIDLKRLPSENAKAMIVAQLAGFIFVSTANESYNQIRECLLLSLSHHSNQKAVVDDVIAVLSKCSTEDSFMKLYSILEKHLVLEKNMENLTALMVVPNWLGEHIVRYKSRILDTMLNLTDRELDQFLASGATQ